MTETEASIYFGIPYLVSAIFTPIAGYYIDKYGWLLLSCNFKNYYIIYLEIVATFLCGISFVILLLLPNCEHCYYAAIPLILLGLGFSIFAAGFWSTIAEEFNADIAGTAYGLCFCC